MTAGAKAQDTGFFQQLFQAAPGWRLGIFGSLFWAAIMTASATIYLWYREWQLEIEYVRIAVLYFAGGMLAFVPALVALDLLEQWRRLDRLQRFAAAFVVFSSFTIAATAFLFSQQFRIYFAQWHEGFLSHLGLNEFVSTSAAAVYYFLGSGLRQYLPLALPALLATSLWWARKPS